jgi:hypothetical protein
MRFTKICNFLYINIYEKNEVVCVERVSVTLGEVVVAESDGGERCVTTFFANVR